MPSYAIYNKETGEILHVHSEFYMDGDKPVEIDVERMMKELGETFPEGVELGLLAVEEPLRPIRSHRHYVDVRTSRLILIERPERKRGRRI